MNYTLAGRIYIISIFGMNELTFFVNPCERSFCCRIDNFANTLFLMKIQDVIRQNVSGYRNRDFALPFSIENIQIPAKATISAIGRTENDMYFLKEGVVQVTTMRGNEERILEFVFPGRFFCAYTFFCYRSHQM
jgi:hypothetical protein